MHCLPSKCMCPSFVSFSVISHCVFWISESRAENVIASPELRLRRAESCFSCLPPGFAGLNREVSPLVLGRPPDCRVGRDSHGLDGSSPGTRDKTSDLEPDTGTRQLMLTRCITSYKHKREGLDPEMCDRSVVLTPIDLQEGWSID